jgi:hypothetical protein
MKSMPLMELWKADRESILQMTIEQIASAAGDGKLSDNSDSQNELREYLTHAGTDSLANYATYCLDNSFSKSGQVLQDIVNELGRRLDYVVENGRYQGVKNAIGYDGIWTDSDHRSLVVEVKTTDAYRLSLDTVNRYRVALISEKQILETSSILIVVGRTDTGELEAQVRGSIHSWHVRIIGIEALVQLVRVKETADNQETIRKIQRLLGPVEYTRIDNLVEVVFAATQDVEEVGADPPVDPDGKRPPSEKTAPSDLAEARKRIIRSADLQIGDSLITKTRATYWSADHRLRIACTISKRYENQGAMKYWYAYHPSWDEFLSEGTDSWLALGCVDLDVMFLIPRNVIYELLPHLNATSKPNDDSYWHLKIAESKPGVYFLKVPFPGTDLDLTTFQTKL